MANNNFITIDFENVQSIKKGNVKIIDNAINIKYGYNGLGKSSLGKAIEFYINNDNEQFEFLRPYTGEEPKITISKKYNKCSSFNKDFIEGWLYKESNNVIDDSYAIFFSDKKTKAKEQSINNLLKDLVNSLYDDNIKKYLLKCETINKNIKFNKANTAITGTCTVGKGFKNGPAFIKKVEGSDLKNYSKIISSPDSPEWFKWFSEGDKYVIDNKCPYCLNLLNKDFSDIQTCIENIVKDNDFKKNNDAKETILTIASISSKSDGDTIKSINEMEDQLDNTSINLLISKVSSANIEYSKIINLRNQSRFSADSVDKNAILSFYNSNRLNDSFFKDIDENIYASATAVNNCIDTIIKQIEEVFSAIEAFNKELVESTKNVNEEINNFLKFAGIPYKFEIKVLGDGNSETIIKPCVDESIVVENVDRHLSYGEANSFSLALFGAINKRNDSDFIVLDDPISSFDENKKFAVMHYLFNPVDGVLKDKTVLLLTHDMEPLLDMVRVDFVNGTNSPNPKEVYANLVLNSKGVVSEIEIKNTDIKSTIQQELDLAKDSTKDDYLRLIHLRRYYDLMGIKHKSNQWQLASNAEHLKQNPTFYNQRQLTQTEINDGTQQISTVINGFDYNSFVAKYTDKTLLSLYSSPSSSNYDKVRIIRPLLDHNQNVVTTDLKLWNFITENYHVENMFLFGVCGIKQIPDYIIDLCDKLIVELKKVIN